MAETDTIQVDSPPQTPPQSPPQTPPQDDKVRALYNEVSKDYDLGDYNTFKQKLQDPDKQKAFYNSVGKDYDLGTFDDFSKKVSGQSQPTISPQQHQQSVNDASVQLNGIIASPAYKKATQSYNTDQINHQLRDVEQKFQDGIINEDQYNSAKNQINASLFQSKDNADKTVEASKANEPLMRKLLTRAKDQNKDKNPALVKSINSAAQLIDQQNLDPQKVSDLNKKINAGQVDYDLNLKRPTYDPGFVGNFMLELKNHFKAGDKADFLSTAPKDQIIAEEEKSREQGAKNDPFTPVPKGQGWSAVSGTIGANAVPLAEGLGTAAAVGAADYISGGATVPLLSPILGGLFMARDASKQALTNTFEQVYHDQRNQGKTPDQAYETAMQQGKFNSAASAIQMGAMSMVGLKTASKPLFGSVWGHPFKTFLKESAPKVLPSLTNLLPELAGQTTLAGITKGAENINAGKPVGQDVGNEMGAMASFLGALHVLGTAKEILTTRGVNVGMNGMANANPDLVEKGVNQLVAQKDLTPDQAQKLKDDLAAQRSLNKGLKENVPEENKQKIQDLIAKRTQLENQLDPEHPDFVDKAYHPDIKEQINGVKKEKADGTTEGKDGINEKIRQLSEPVKSDKDEPLLKSPMDQAKELIDANKDKFEGDVQRNMASTNPEGFLEYIAGQVHNGRRQELEEQGGMSKSLLDLAVKVHPEHIIQEPRNINDINVGDNVQWTSQGTDQFSEPRKVTKISDDGKWGFVEGSDTGIPLDQLNKPKAENKEIPLTENKDLRSIDYGEHKGKKETPERKEEIKNDIINNTPIGKTGDKFSGFLSRFIPAWKGILDGKEHNTTVVTSSSAIKAMDIHEEMGRPDISELVQNGELTERGQEFAKRFNELKPEEEGKVKTYKGANGDIKVLRHGETHENKLSEFRENETPLSGEGKITAAESSVDLNNELKGEAPPEIIHSGLTRTEQTANIIRNNLKSKQNAIPEQSTNEMGVREQGTVGETVGGRNTKPEKPTGQVNEQPNTEEKGKTEGEKEPRTVGVSHQSLKDIADKIGLEEPKEGDVLSPKEYSDRGQALLKAGADQDQLESDFKKDGLVNADRISVARAQYNKLVKDASDAYENNGKNSLEYQKAKAKADQWQKEVLKPMITKGFAETGRASQGETDIDTGSFVSMSRAFQDKYGKEPTPAQAKLLEEASGRVKDLTNKVSDLEQKLTEAIDKNVGTGKVKATYTEKAKAYADAFRKLKTKPFTFKDENGNEIDVHTAGIKWNDIVELGAKAIEKTGEIADGVKAAVDALKDADWYKTLSQSDKDKFATQLQAHYQENEPEIAVKDLGQKFADKTDSKFDPKDAKDIWQYAKDNYLHKGATFDDMINGVGTDLGLTNQQVRDAITSPKSAKVISDQMYEQQYRQQQAIRDANIALKTANQSKFERNYVVKFVKSLPSVWFTLKTFGHGTVGFVTHSGMNIFTPSKWGTFWHNFAKQFKFAFGGTTKRGLAAYQQEMTDLIHRPQFTFWKRNGLAVDPVKSYDDYQQFAKGVAKLGEMGDRGFNALKLQRYDLAEMYYNRLSDVEKSDPQTAKNIASIVNHSTGTADVPVPKLIGTAIFAPRLEASRWSRLAMEPGKAVKTLYNWKEASPADKVAAKIVGKRAGEMFATYMSALAANSAALTIAGSAQKINYTDPTQSDWLKFKAGDKTLDISGGMLSAMHFVGSLMKESIGQRKMVRGVPEPRSETMEKTVGGYVRGKLSPIASTVADVTSQADFTGRPLPFSSDKGTKYKPQYTWGEYIEDQQLPIPVSEGFKIVHDQMRDRGMDEATTNQIFNGIFSGVASGATGARVSTDYSNDKHEAKTESKQKFHP